MDGIARCLEMLSVARMSDPYVGLDQAALEEMLAGFEPTSPTG
jgi:hypothetical protein